MVRCQWSVEGLCQVFLDKNWNHLPCDGLKDRSCEGRYQDIVDIRDPQPKKNPGRGGRRAGAGAPRGNLNALKDGVYSLQLKRIHLEEKRILRTAREKRAKRSGHQAAR